MCTQSTRGRWRVRHRRIARKEGGCGLWFTQNRIYVAGMFFRHFKSNLTSLRIQMLWIVTHVALVFLPFVFQDRRQGLFG